MIIHCDVYNILNDFYQSAVGHFPDPPQRYAHLFCGEPDPGSAPAAPAGHSRHGTTSRVEALELEVGELRVALDALEQRFEAFRKQFE